MQSRALPYLSLCQELVSVALELSTDFGHRQTKCGCLERQRVTYYIKYNKSTQFQIYIKNDHKTRKQQQRASSIRVGFISAVCPVFCCTHLSLSPYSASLLDILSLFFSCHLRLITGK